jgi:hypothetical protein
MVLYALLITQESEFSSVMADFLRSIAGVDGLPWIYTRIRVTLKQAQSSSFMRSSGSALTGFIAPESPSGQLDIPLSFGDSSSAKY